MTLLDFILGSVAASTVGLLLFYIISAWLRSRRQKPPTDPPRYVE